MESYDLIVLGGGRASNLAIAAANAGRKVALIERDRLGGTCPNRGCVPSKLLIGFAEAARRVREADRHFIDASFNSIDLDRVFQSTSDYVRGVDSRYEGRLPENLELIRGHGRFSSNKVIRIDESGRELTADTIVIATGTRPRPAPFPELPVWTSDELFPLESAPPKSLTIVGGGFIGCELGGFFSAVGVDTRIFVRGQNLLPKEDTEIAAVFCDEFTRHTPVSFGHSLARLSHDGEHFHSVFTDADGNEVTRTSEQVLFATGRIPNADTIGLENTDIQRDKRGFVATNEQLETGVEGVFAAGDIAGKYILQHAASFDIHYLRRKLLKGTEGPIDYGAMPHAVFTDPEVAAVGVTEDELISTGEPYVKVFEDWLPSARAMASRLDYPRIKLLVSPRDYRILGCHLVGPDSSTLLHQVMTVMNLKNDVRELAEMIYIHPALNEAILAAAVKAVKAVRESESC